MVFFFLSRNGRPNGIHNVLFNDTFELNFFFGFFLSIAHIKRSTALQSPEREAPFNEMEFMCIVYDVVQLLSNVVILLHFQFGGRFYFFHFHFIPLINVITNRSWKLWLHLVRCVFRFFGFSYFFFSPFSIRLLIFYYCFCKDLWMHSINNRE